MPDAGFGGGPDNGRGDFGGGSDNDRGGSIGPAYGGTADDGSDFDSNAGLGSAFAGFGTDADAAENNPGGVAASGWGDNRVESGRRDQTGFMDAIADTISGRNIASRAFHRGLAGAAAGVATMALGPGGVAGALLGTVANAAAKQAVDKAKDDQHTSFGDDLASNMGDFATGILGGLYGSQFGQAGAYAGGKLARGIGRTARKGGKFGSGTVVTREGMGGPPLDVAQAPGQQVSPTSSQFAGFVDTGEQHPFAEG